MGEVILGLVLALLALVAVIAAASIRNGSKHDAKIAEAVEKAVERKEAQLKTLSDAAIELREAGFVKTAKWFEEESWK